MTTASWTGVLDHTGDAAFRAWASEVSTQLAAVGLVQTADTGQINLTTATRPAVNTAAGYQIWRFADSTLFLKLEYGTGSVATTPQMWITVGTGSNGSGTLTGQLSTRAIFTLQTTPVSTVTSYTSRICRVADAFYLDWKELAGGAGANGGALLIGKTVDGTGAATTTGFAVIRSNGGVGQYNMQCVRTAATAFTGTDTTKNFMVPGEPANSLAANGNNQAYQIPGAWPDVAPFAWGVLAFTAEAARGTTFSVAMVGSTSHTYVSPGPQTANVLGGNGYASGTYVLCGIFE